MNHGGAATMACRCPIRTILKVLNAALDHRAAALVVRQATHSDRRVNLGVAQLPKQGTCASKRMANAG
jgi:hypothetical protein